MAFLLLVIGFILLIKGSHFFVSGASGLGKKFGIQQIVIGMTIVAFSTSAPEFVVSIIGSLKGENEIVFGNIMGSNIANILLIIGLGTLIKPIFAKYNTRIIDIPFLLVTSILILILGQDMVFEGGISSSISRSDGIILLLFFTIFFYNVIRNSRVLKYELTESTSNYTLLQLIGLTCGGLLMLIGGGELIIGNAITIGEYFGITERVIGITIVALGTSLPELTVCLVALYKKNKDIAIGNIVGSNIFNTLFILGSTALLHNIPLTENNVYDMIMNTIATSILLRSFYIGKMRFLEKKDGITMIILYVIYIGTLFLFLG